MKPLITIPAAGASTRMHGRDKLIEEIGGKPLLRRQTEIALATDCPVMVCLPPKAGARHDAIADLPVTQLLVKDAAEGLGATLRTAALFAARHAPDRSLMILLPDVPDITTFDLKTIISTFERTGANTATRATDDSNLPGTPLIVPARLIARFTLLSGDKGGQDALKGESVQTVKLSGQRATRTTDDSNLPGTPLIVPARLIARFTLLSGDKGGQDALKGESVQTVKLSGQRATRDLDTPEDWEKWRQSRVSRPEDQSP